MDYIYKLKGLLPRSLHSHLGAVRRWLRTLPARTRRQEQRLLADPALEAKERLLLKLVETRISAAMGCTPETARITIKSGSLPYGPLRKQSIPRSLDR